MLRSLQDYAPHWLLFVGPIVLVWLARISHNATPSCVRAVARRRSDGVDA